MLVTIDAAIVTQEVRVNLDEIGLNDSEFDSSKDEYELDTIIKSKISEAYRYVLCRCDAEMLTDELIAVKEVEYATKTSDPSSTDLIGTVEIDGGYLRFLYANSPSWPYPVYDAILWRSPEYAMLSNPLTTGTLERPKVGVRPMNEYKELEPGIKVPKKGVKVDLYCVDEASGEGSGVVAYIPSPSSYDDRLTLTPELYSAFIYYVTALTLLTLRDGHSDAMMRQALSLMGVDLSNVE